MRERKTSEHGNRGASPNSTTLCISHFFFSDLGYDRNHYTKIKIAETKTPWKSTWSEDACEIYVRNDIYENVLHSPDPGIDWPDGATRR